ncbi:MAG: ZIP family metal transporter [Sphaerochaetaceae bacterium]|nr:ZIP family metal transporter [Sphaerochaetaceae bacterium]
MFPVLVTLLAGLFTVIGALFVSHVRNRTFEAVSLAFATGVMLMIALSELIPSASEENGLVLTLFLVFAGAGLSWLLDVIFPHHHDDGENDRLPGHYMGDCECVHGHSVHHGMIAALLLHNILEGLATGIAVTSEARLGVSMAMGIAIHNIPIGSTLAVSVISSGKTKPHAVLVCMLVGLSQPLGALAGELFLNHILTAQVMAVLNSLVAGILIFIAFDELWPASRSAGKRAVSILALIAGIIFIPLTEMLF